MRFLVIGGAGYIGSHFVAEAKRQGHDCTVFDNLSRGHRAAVDPSVPLLKASILDEEVLTDTLKSRDFDAIFHFAAYALVGESVTNPELYYENNVEGVRVLMEVMRKLRSTAALVFSSSCAVFGTPSKLPISEGDPKNPQSPYGRSKLINEYQIEDYCRAHGLKGMALRYFNACGADPDGRIGEDHQPESHLVPNILKAAIEGTPLTINGSDFKTRDGTCIRDYIHVTDLSDAHIKAAEYLKKAKPGTYEAIHLGTGNGYSNFEILNVASQLLNRPIPYTIGARRPGDPAELYADNRKAVELLGFRTRYSDLETILKTALAWHQKHPSGYSAGA